MTIVEAIREGRIFSDGGCGSFLQANGLKPGELPETWNVLHPEVITRMHYEYCKAGANICSTNTFGANSLKFGDEGDFSLEKLVAAAIQNARAGIAQAEAEGVSGPHFVGLDVGSIGQLLKPLGTLDFEDAVSIFKKTMSAGAAHGADFIFIETMNDLYESKAAVLAAKEVCDLPVLISTTYDESGKLLTGADPRTVVATMEGLGVDAVGVNCGLGPAQMMGVIEQLIGAASIPVIVTPNAGIPRTENGKTVYDVDPELFAEEMVKVARLGPRIMGGCCGTTPAHIAAMTTAVKDIPVPPLTEKNLTLITSYTHAVEFGKRPILIGERINPTGKKKFKEALRNHDIDYILQEALTQQEKHADVLDVNVGLPEIDEVAVMLEVVEQLQAVTDLPLQIDTTNPEAMELALRRYNGKAMINSVNGKEEVMEQVFPLAKKYGGLVVALTIDEDGIPTTAEGRLAIVDKIYKRAADYGIAAKDIIIDPLAMSISADPLSAQATLDALRMIKEQYGGLTSLGVSNISFGLPNRDLINATFFSMAMYSGLSAAIMNPNSTEMMKSYYTFCALTGLDENCSGYIDYAAQLPAMTVAPTAGGAAPASVPEQGSSAAGGGEKENSDPLIIAIVKGLKERAGALTKDLLAQGTDSMEIIDGKLIPALDIVGKGFEQKRVFLPQLLMAAEAAGASFDVIRETMKAAGADQTKKGKIVLATVKGDIHDIGKNIVKVLLENYGYEVLDLGKDVDPELVVQTTIEQQVPLVGLSALMTTTVPSMEETILQLREKAPGTKVVVGGAVLTQEYADMIGADYYASDAMETVRYAERLFSE